MSGKFDRGLQIDEALPGPAKFPGAHDFPKFLKVGAVMEHKPRKVGT
jgi:hypothetical protein